MSTFQNSRAVKLKLTLQSIVQEINLNHVWRKNGHISEAKSGYFMEKKNKFVTYVLKYSLTNNCLMRKTGLTCKRAWLQLNFNMKKYLKLHYFWSSYIIRHKIVCHFSGSCDEKRGKIMYLSIANYCGITDSVFHRPKQRIQLPKNTDCFSSIQGVYKS